MHRSGGGQRFFEIKVNPRHPVMAVVRLSNTMSELPNVKDFDPYGCDLDAQCAWSHFGGLTLEEAHLRFSECSENYQEDFMFMGSRAFAFYFPVIDRYLREAIELTPDDRGDRQSWILPQCIQHQFDQKNLHCVRTRHAEAMDLCNFMLGNIESFANDWDPPSEISARWRSLRNHLLTLR